ncbi:MAG TPA: hypothetical protein VG870_09760 [Chitinophagaceae bacterium]|nr:hypothetical protein [Chitinophagaceae bacterium]
MNRIKQVCKEEHLVVVLFVAVLVTFSFAKRDSKDLDKLYLGTKQIQPSASTLPAAPATGPDEPSSRLKLN